MGELVNTSNGIIGHYMTIELRIPKYVARLNLNPMECRKIGNKGGRFNKNNKTWNLIMAYIYCLVVCIALYVRVYNPIAQYRLLFYGL